MNVGILLLQAALTLALVAAAAYGAWEIRRWQTPAGQETVTPRQRRIRGWGLFFLLAALGLWLGGTYRPVPQPLTRMSTRAEKKAALRFLAYWTLTVCCAVPLVPLALLDTRENLRRLTKERKREKSELLRGLVSAHADDSPDPERGRP